MSIIFERFRNPSDRHIQIRWLLLPLTVIYFFAGKLGLEQAFVHANASAVWPPTGIALAACLIWGYRVWPAIFLGAFLVNITTAGSLITSGGIAIGNTLEGVVGAWMVQQFARGRSAFERPADVFLFAVLAGLVAPVISATIGVTVLSIEGYAQWANFGKIWLTWWMGDLGGAVVVAPMLILWSHSSSYFESRRHILEAAVLLLAVLLCGDAIFGTLLPIQDKNYPIAFFSIPVMIWSAFRFEQRETATAVFLLAWIATWGTLKGYGPFIQTDSNASLLLLQMFLVVISVSVMALGAAVYQTRQAQQDTLLLMQELKRSNADLEQFAYVTSHDLQEPLRMIVSYLQLMERHNQGRLDEKTTQYMAFVIERALYMRTLIQNLLAYACIQPPDSAYQAVDCTDIFRKVLQNLDMVIQESQASITWDALPTLHADPVHLERILQNLISNAIKYSKDAPPSIHVSCRHEKQEWIFSVQDNGIGIAPEHREQVFKIFQRLHISDKMPGTGIGLATCKKMVENHGGRIWVESVVNRGAVFYFTIPDRNS